MSCDPQFEKHYPRNSSDGQMGNRKIGKGGKESERERREE